LFSSNQPAQSTLTRQAPQAEFAVPAGSTNGFTLRFAVASVRTLSDFRARWLDPQKREPMLKELREPSNWSGDVSSPAIGFHIVALWGRDVPTPNLPLRHEA
jgi:hypothetical protein